MCFWSVQSSQSYGQLLCDDYSQKHPCCGCRIKKTICADILNNLTPNLQDRISLVLYELFKSHHLSHYLPWILDLKSGKHPGRCLFFCRLSSEVNSQEQVLCRWPIYFMSRRWKLFGGCVRCLWSIPASGLLLGEWCLLWNLPLADSFQSIQTCLHWPSLSQNCLELWAKPWTFCHRNRVTRS